jgi:hypothetical protein
MELLQKWPSEKLTFKKLLGGREQLHMVDGPELAQNFEILMEVIDCNALMEVRIFFLNSFPQNFRGKNIPRFT